MPLISLNAQLMSSDASYRAAGIHTYIVQVLHHLAAAANEAAHEAVPGEPSKPDGAWQFDAWVNRPYTASIDGITLHRAAFDTTSPLKRIAWEQVVLPRLLAGDDPDLHHAMAFAAPLRCPVPTVVSVMDLSFVHYPARLSSLRRRYLETITPRSCRNARRVIAISQSTADDLTAQYGIEPSRIDVTPLGYDSNRFRPLPDDTVEQFRSANDLPARFWLFLGTIEPRKNLPMLLEAYADLPTADRLPLVIAGGRGWGQEAVEQSISAFRLQGDVSLVGFVPYDDIALWYNSAEVFLYPSVYEGFGLPVLEAMACGTPVVTTDVSSLPEIAADSSVCLAPDDPSAWRDTLLRLAHDATWRDSLSQSAIKRAGLFTWHRTACATLDSYRRALQS